MEPSGAKRGRPRMRGRPANTVPSGGSSSGTPSPNPNAPIIQPPAPSAAATNPMVRIPPPSTAPGGAAFGGPSFTNDILNRLPEPKRAEMMTLVQRFRSRQISIQEFLNISQGLLGEQLYAVLTRGMNSTGRSVTVPNTGARPMGPPGNASNAGLAQTGNNALPADDSMVDVNKLDSAALQDVMQYSGVDLKAEAEMIYRSQDTISQTYLQSTIHTGRDARLNYDYFFNEQRLKTLVSQSVYPRGVTDLSEDCLEMIAMAVQQRLLKVISELAAISRHRCDVGRARFKIKVENDPKKQLWLVDQFHNQEGERWRNGKGSLTSSDSLAAARAKQKKVERRMGEDVAVKTKLANVTAAAATGLQMKSWMTDPSAYADPSAMVSSSNLADGAALGGGGDEGPTIIPLHFSQAPSMTPITDRELQAHYAQRTINIRDLIYFAENDPHLRRTAFLVSLYNNQQQ